jgi:putative ABC transport system permease protein
MEAGPMTVWHVILREIAHRRLNFALAVVAVATAAASLVATEFLLRCDAETTRRILAAKQAETEAAVAAKEAAVQAAGAELEDAIRGQMKGLGFNVIILPATQDPAELHLSGGLSQTMPESHVQRLADSKIMTINHLLPTVMRAVRWPEQDMDIVLYGTRGEVPLLHRDQKKPVLAAVAPGQMVVGHTIHDKLGLQTGQSVTLMGRTFQVSRLHPQRGSVDDVTVWIDLREAQELLSLENLVHAILALECECAGDRISQIRAEITGILPGTQVIERASQALARAEARAQAKATAETALATERVAGADALRREAVARGRLQAGRRLMAGVLVPLVVVLAAVAVAVLTVQNVRHRRSEIGVFRALGLRGSQVVAIFLGKALLSGLLGGLVGVAVGLGSGGLIAGLLGGEAALGQRACSGVPAGMEATLMLTPLVAVLLAVSASWLAALGATTADAATVLHGE